METGDYTVLQAKRMIAVINLITANGKIACACDVFEKTSSVCVYLSCVHVSFVCPCAFSVCVCVFIPCWLMLALLTAVAQCE